MEQFFDRLSSFFGAQLCVVKWYGIGLQLREVAGSTPGQVATLAKLLTHTCLCHKAV